MSNAKSTERPTFAEAGTADSSHVSVNGVKRESGKARSAVATGKREVVAVRLSPDELAVLDLLREQLSKSSTGAPLTRSDALREAIVTVGEALSAGRIATLDTRMAKAIAVRQPRVVDADERVLEELRDAMRELAERYSGQAFQFQKIGNNWNQITKLAHAGERVDADAVHGVGRSLDRLADAMERDAKRDARIVNKLREVLP